MKFLRIGSLNQEKPAIIDGVGVIRDLTSIISDFNPNTINQNTIEKIKKINLEKLPKVDSNIRIGPCVANPEKFIGIGLNYSDHAEETGMKPPSEPIIFIKANSCISGPDDDVIIPKDSKKSDWEIELGLVIGKKAQYIPEDKSPAYDLYLISLCKNFILSPSTFHYWGAYFSRIKDKICLTPNNNFNISGYYGFSNNKDIKADWWTEI